MASMTVYGFWDEAAESKKTMRRSWLVRLRIGKSARTFNGSKVAGASDTPPSY